MSNILLVDDEPRFLEASAETLRLAGHHVVTADCVKAARTAIERSRPDFAFVDLMLPDGNGLELLTNLSGNPPCQVTLITGNPVIVNHVRELSGPDVQYLTKPLHESALLELVSVPELEPHSEEPRQPRLHFGLLVGESPPMQKVYESIEIFAASKASVLVCGETGSGKEYVARALHRESGRGGKLITLNCGALSRELIASELFGHERGSFTGASRLHEGAFERADAGTLFLDEITEMPVELQTALLRAIESGRVTRVGGERDHEFDVRIVAATNRDVREAVANNVLREDLYYRLSEFAIAIPPLRQRREDIPALVELFLRRLNDQYDMQKQVTERCIERLMEYDWPGNVRELKHIVHRIFVLNRGDEARIEAPENFGSPLTSESSTQVEAGRSISDVEKELILKTMEHFNGDKLRAAETLGISVRTLYNRLRQYGRDTA